MTREELRKECAEILAESAVKNGISHSKEYYLSTFQEKKNDPIVKSMIDAMMEAAAKAWEQACEEQKLRCANNLANSFHTPDDSFNFYVENCPSVLNPYQKPE